MGKILIIEAIFYEHISKMLRQGAKYVLDQHEYAYDTISVPGALEIPATLNFALNSTRKYDAYVVLGCIIRGETSHYDIVCNESARGVYDLVLQHNLALGNGILTVEDQAQAIVRADPQQKDKGGAAAEAALNMLALKQKYLMKA